MTGKSKATDGVLDATQFLIERLEEFERADFEDDKWLREYTGHVVPALVRLKIALRHSLAALPPPTGEPVAWGMFSSSAGCLSTTTDEAVAKRWAAETTTGISVGPLYRHPSVVPLQVEPAEGVAYLRALEALATDCENTDGWEGAATDLRMIATALTSQSAELLSLRRKVEETEAERDEALAEIERMIPKFVAYEYLESPAGREMAEERVVALERKVEEQRRALERLANAKALQGVRELVAGWNGEGREDGPYERHRDELGATLPATDCGAVYELDEALSTARALAGDRQ